MIIKKIKLLNGGYKGAEIQFTKNRQDKKREYTDTIDEERNTPIHSDLDVPLKALRLYALEICGLIRGNMEKSEVKYIIGECELVKLEMESDYFVLHCNMLCINNKQFKFTTPKVYEDDDYHNYDAVIKLIETIKDEAIQYLDGTKELSDEELAVRYIHSGKDKSEDASRYESMNAEEKAVYHQTILENIGWIVMRPDDVVEDNSDNHAILNAKDEVEEQEIELPINEKF